MTPDDPRYYDPRDLSDIGIGFCHNPDKYEDYRERYCTECGDECGGAENYHTMDELTFCVACYEDLPVCGDGDHKFTGEAIEVAGLDGFVFCSEAHAEFARKEWDGSPQVQDALKETA